MFTSLLNTCLILLFDSNSNTLIGNLYNNSIQASMVTSSATRNTIYRSFALGENIGDITAKGEAQIAVVDMLGILSGILLSNIVGTCGHWLVLFTIFNFYTNVTSFFSFLFPAYNPRIKPFEHWLYICFIDRFGYFRYLP